MADSIIETTETNALSTEQLDAKAQLDAQMALALGGGIIPENQQEQHAEQNNATQDAEIVPLTFEAIKEKFAYEKPEDAIKEIEELRAFKATPPTPQKEEIKFENEQSKKLFEAIRSGKQKEAYAILAEQERLDTYTTVEVTKDNAADIIKLGIQISNPKLTSQEIDFQYKQDYVAPKEPVQKATEDDEDFAERHSEWKERADNIEMKRTIAAKITQPQLESHKAKLVLPDIDAPVDDDYIQWKKSQEAAPQIEAERLAELKSFTPKAFETKINFNDEANKVAFEYQDEPTAEEFNNTVEMVTDINKFYGKFIGQDGKPDRKGFAKAIHFAVNGERMLMEAMKQAKNATIKAFLPYNSGGVVRQMPQTQQVSELDAYMRQAGVIK